MSDARSVGAAPDGDRKVELPGATALVLSSKGRRM